MRPLAPLACLALAAGVATADPVDTGESRPPAAEPVASLGAALPWTELARHDGASMLAIATGGWDAARHDPMLESAIEGRLGGRVGLRAGAAYVGRDGRMAPTIAISVDVLRQETAGVDAAIVGGYEDEGFNLVPAVTARLALARGSDATRVLASVGVGVGTALGERYGDARLGALHRLAPGWRAGVDARARVDLERDRDEPAGEPDWEVLAGPVTSYAVGRYVVTGGVGIAAFQARLSPRREVGPQAMVGIGSVF